MKRRTCLLGISASALACSVWSQSRRRWRLATGYRAESFHGQNLKLFAADIESATAGALAIELHANNSLAPLAQIPAAVRDERADAGEVIMTGLVKDIPVAGADSVPFIVRNYSDARRLWHAQQPQIEAAFAARGFRSLYAVPWPPQCLYTARSIAGVEDLRGARMRTYNSTTVRIAQLLGATPVEVAMTEVAKALAGGLIDSMITSAVTGVENRVWDHLKHYYEINAWFPKNIVFVSSRAFDGLPPEQRDAVLAAARAAEARGWAASQVAARESTETLRRNGMRVDAVPSELSAHLRRMGEKFSLEWVREVGAAANSIFIPYYTNV